MQVSPYLFFHGTGAAAAAFYEAAGLGRLHDAMRYRDAPGDHGPDDWLMHASFTGEGVNFMLSDSAGAQPMAGTAMSIGLADLPRAEALFAALSKGGTDIHPLEKQFWGAHFARFTDKFGVQWMINCT